MIEKFYASHIKTSLDTAAINVRREAIPAVPLRPVSNENIKRLFFAIP